MMTHRVIPQTDYKSAIPHGITGKRKASIHGCSGRIQRKNGDFVVEKLLACRDVFTAASIDRNRKILNALDAIVHRWRARPHFEVMRPQLLPCSSGEYL